jgi:hypothetical protein
MQDTTKLVAIAIVENEKSLEALVDLLAANLSDLDYTAEAVNAFAEGVRKHLPKGMKPNVMNMVNACHMAGADRKVSYWFVQGLKICKDPSIIPHLNKLYDKSNRQAKANALKEEKSEAQALFDLVSKRLEKMDKKQSNAFKKLIKAI